MTLPVGNLGTRFGEGKMAFETTSSRLVDQAPSLPEGKVHDLTQWRLHPVVHAAPDFWTPLQIAFSSCSRGSTPCSCPGGAWPRLAIAMPLAHQCRHHGRLRIPGIRPALDRGPVLGFSYGAWAMLSEWTSSSVTPAAIGAGRLGWTDTKMIATNNTRRSS